MDIGIEGVERKGNLLNWAFCRENKAACALPLALLQYAAGGVGTHNTSMS